MLQPKTKWCSQQINSSTKITMKSWILNHYKYYCHQFYKHLFIQFQGLNTLSFKRTFQIKGRARQLWVLEVEGESCQRICNQKFHEQLNLKCILRQGPQEQQPCFQLACSCIKDGTVEFHVIIHRKKYYNDGQKMSLPCGRWLRHDWSNLLIKSFMYFDSVFLISFLLNHGDYSNMHEYFSATIFFCKSDWFPKVSLYFVYVWI